MKQNKIHQNKKNQNKTKTKLNNTNKIIKFK